MKPHFSRQWISRSKRYEITTARSKRTRTSRRLDEFCSVTLTWDYLAFLSLRNPSSFRLSSVSVPPSHSANHFFLLSLVLSRWIRFRCDCRCATLKSTAKELSRQGPSECHETDPACKKISTTRGFTEESEIRVRSACDSSSWDNGWCWGHRGSATAEGQHFHRTVPSFRLPFHFVCSLSRGWGKLVLQPSSTGGADSFRETALKETPPVGVSPTWQS